MKQNRFAGFMVWALDLDDFKNSCGFGKYPLLTAMNQELGVSVISHQRKPKMYVQPTCVERYQNFFKMHDELQEYNYTSWESNFFLYYFLLPC